MNCKKYMKGAFFFLIFFIIAICISSLFCNTNGDKNPLKENFHFEVTPAAETCMPFTKPNTKPSPQFCCNKLYAGRPGGFEMTAGWWKNQNRPDGYTKEDCENITWTNPNDVKPKLGYNTLCNAWCK